jgi:hypothetical protein
VHFLVVRVRASVTRRDRRPAEEACSAAGTGSKCQLTQSSSSQPPWCHAASFHGQNQKWNGKEKSTIGGLRISLVLLQGQPCRSQSSRPRSSPSSRILALTRRLLSTSSALLQKMSRGFHVPP